MESAMLTRDTARTMSGEKAELIRQGTDAMNRGDPDGFVACLTPDVVWEEGGDVLPGLRGTYRGREEARSWYQQAFLETWETFQIEINEITEGSDDRVFMEGLFTARGKASGAAAELHFWSVFWFREGKISRRMVAWTRA